MRYYSKRWNTCPNATFPMRWEDRRGRCHQLAVTVDLDEGEPGGQWTPPTPPSIELVGVRLKRDGISDARRKRIERYIFRKISQDAELLYERFERYIDR